MTRLLWLGTIALIAAGPLEAKSGRASGMTPAKPLGNPGEWVTTDDYPPAALRANQTGRSSFKLDIDPNGHVSRCTITHSSGTAALDSATCTLLSARASFTPAVDRTGRTLASTYSSSVMWRIPRDEDAEKTKVSLIRCAMAPAGEIVIAMPIGCLI